MALTLIDSGTQTASVPSEHVLSTQTDPNVYVLVVDTAAMALGDVLELKIYSKCLTGGTERIAYQATYAQPQAQPNKYSVPIPCDIYCKVTLNQKTGTTRDFPWALLSL